MTPGRAALVRAKAAAAEVERNRAGVGQAAARRRQALRDAHEAGLTWLQVAEALDTTVDAIMRCLQRR